MSQTSTDQETSKQKSHTAPFSTATPAEAAAHFRAKLAFETDGADVRLALRDGTANFVLVDTRSAAAWQLGRASGAVHIPTADIATRVPAEYPQDTAFVVYCWSPGCNGADKAAEILAKLGHPVKLMIGGFEYWAREGYPVETDAGTERLTPDPLTSPLRLSNAP